MPERHKAPKSTRDLTNESREKVIEHFDGKVVTLLNNLGVGHFRVVPRTMPGTKERTGVGVTQDGKLSGQIWNYEIREDILATPTTQEDPGPHILLWHIDARDVARAVGIVLRDNGLRVYQGENPGELIVKSRDGSGSPLFEVDENGRAQSVQGVGLHSLYGISYGEKDMDHLPLLSFYQTPFTLYNSKEESNSPPMGLKVYSDSLWEQDRRLLTQRRFYEQDGKLMLRREEHYSSDGARTWTTPPPIECQPFTMTEEELKAHIQEREEAKKAEK